MEVIYWQCLWKLSQLDQWAKTIIATKILWQNKIILFFQYSCEGIIIMTI